ncbi:hypothetical protein TWF281_011285 [Arthrobotrys megalospora]
MPTEYHISTNVDLIIHLYDTSYLDLPQPPSEDGSFNSSASPDDVVKYYVTAWSLQQASPIFSRIISPDPRFKQPDKIEHSGKECTLITLEDDQPEALAIVLNLLHFNSKSLPSIEDISWDTVYDIAQIWDKYDITTLIRPPWIKHFQKFMTRPDYESWLFIGKTFQEGEGYVDLTARLVVEVGPMSLGKGAGGPDAEETIGLARSGKYIYTSDWPDFVREHITSENKLMRQRLQSILITWKWSFKGKRPRALCTCYGNVPRYNRHSALSNSITDLLSDDSMLASPPAPLPLDDDIPGGIRLASRLRDIEGVGTWQWNGSIAALRRRMAVIRNCMADRDMRQVRHMLENADIYDLCPLEESALRVLYDFDQTIEVVKGIGIDGEIVDVPLGRLIDDAKSDPWNLPGDGKRWDTLAMLGIRISGIFAVVSVLVFAVALGKGWGVKLVESGVVV